MNRRPTIAHKGRTAEIVVRVHYLDDFDQPQVIAQTLMVDTYAEESPTIDPDTAQAREEEEEEEGFWHKVWRFLRGLLGLGS